MEYRPLGRTGRVTTRMGLGLAALGRPGYINLGHAADLERDYDVRTMERHAHEVLDAAHRAGMRYFDVARSYGRAEAFLGSWLASTWVPHGSVTVASKWGYVYTADWRVDAETHEVKDHTRETLERQLGESREGLGEHLYLYQIHSATLESGVLRDDRVLRRLAELRSGGLRIGLTLSGPRQRETLERAIAVRVDGERVFDVVQATWNLLERSVEPALLDARREGLGVVVKEGLANGRLTSRNDAPEFAPKRRILEEIARDQGVGLDALALGVVLSRSWVDVCLSGAATVGQLESNLQALDVRVPPEMTERLDELVEDPEDYWATRKQLPWN